MSDEFELSDEDTAHLYNEEQVPTVTVIERRYVDPLYAEITFQLQPVDDEGAATLYISLNAPTIRREPLGLFVERCSDVDLVVRVFDQAMAEGRLLSLVELLETLRRDLPGGYKDDEELFIRMREELYGGAAKNS